MKNISKFAFLILLLCGFILPYGGQAQDEGFIYGKITTIDDKVFAGPIRWGKEEVFWSDMFNASKRENENLQYLSREEREKLEEKRSRENGFTHWVNTKVKYYMSNDDDHAHQFVCQFGEISSLRPTGSNNVEMTLRNGDRFELRGEGYNDVGTNIKIMDAEIGGIELAWARIEKIEFSNTPKLSSNFGEPLYGTVETYSGSFTGYVQWDHDERLSTDKLDGDTADGDLSIPFGNIRSIEREGFSGSRVMLKSGRDLNLRGSNDVNSENRGIIVSTEKYGRVDIPWKEFKKVIFTDKPSVDMKTYSDFKKQSKLEGTVVTTDGNSYQGRISYDLDEESTYEVIQGKSDDVEYILALGDVKKISPKNYDFSSIELKNGQKILLGDSQDVSDKNSGILIFRGEGNPIYVPWEKVKDVVFN